MSTFSSSISLDSTFAQECRRFLVDKFQMSVGIIDLILAHVAKHETFETRLARDIWNLNIAELPWDIVNVISHYRPIQNNSRRSANINALFLQVHVFVLCYFSQIIEFLWHHIGLSRCWNN